MGVNLHLKYDPSHRTNPGYILAAEKLKKPDPKYPKFTVTCSTPTPSHTVPNFDVSFACSEGVLDPAPSVESLKYQAHNGPTPSPGHSADQRKPRVKGRRSTGSMSPSPKLRTHTLPNSTSSPSPRVGKRSGTSPSCKSFSADSNHGTVSPDVRSHDSRSRDNLFNDTRSDETASVSTVTRSIR